MWSRKIVCFYFLSIFLLIYLAAYWEFTRSVKTGPESSTRPKVCKLSNKVVKHKTIKSNTNIQGLGCWSLFLVSLKCICEVWRWRWVIRSGSQSAFQLHSNALDGVEVRALRRPANFFHTKLGKQFLYRPDFVHKSIVTLKLSWVLSNIIVSWQSRFVLPITILNTYISMSSGFKNSFPIHIVCVQHLKYDLPEKITSSVYDERASGSILMSPTCSFAFQFYDPIYSL